MTSYFTRYTQFACALCLLLAAGCSDDTGPAQDSGVDLFAYPDRNQPPLSCTPSNCYGCCAGTSCVEGNSILYCGAGGSKCQACTTSERCSQGTCAKNACDANSCPSGCCDDSSTCQNGTTSTSCGTGGTKCAVCTKDQACVDSKCISSTTTTLYKVILASAKMETVGIAACFVGLGGLLEVACDLYAKVVIGKTTTTSKTQQNENEPTWNETLMIASGKTLQSKVSVVLYDADTGPDMLICIAEHTVTSADLTGGTLKLACKDAVSIKYGTVVIKFEEVKP